ncbi:MAG: hypothetical protein JXQ74_02720, partial [Alphaproteobacteria bacterium]|nr:hypothetical protein [Alphaproteobacteria bacterium]
MRTLKLSLLTFFSLAFIGQQGVYAQGATQAQLAALQAQEATLLAENKTLKQKIKTTKDQIAKKKKAIRTGAIIGSIGAVTGAGGLLFAKDRKHKTAQIEEDIALQKERPELIEKIIKLAAKLCATQGEKDCELTYGGFDLAEGIEDLSGKTLIELRTRYVDLQRWEEYHRMVVYLAERGSCECLELKTCTESDNVKTEAFDDLVVEYEKASFDALKTLEKREVVKEKLEKEINSLYLKLEIEYKDNSQNLAALKAI